MLDWVAGSISTVHFVPAAHHFEELMGGSDFQLYAVSYFSL
jgi:hypothetical protein